jgi:chitodextrinase
MGTRRIAGIAGVLAVAVVFTAAAPAKKPPPPPAGGGSSSPTAPSNLRITGSTNTSVSLAWDASVGNSSFWYCVQRDAYGCIRVDPPLTAVTIGNLMPNTTFNYSVYAIDAKGNRSGSSNTVTYTTPPDTTPPSAPTLSATAVYPTRVHLSWTASTDDTSNQVWYTLYVDGAAREATNVVFDLAPGSTHVFKVTARDRSGNVAESNVLSITTPTTTDATPPSAPTNLRAGPQTNTCEAWLSWDASTDDTDAQSDIRYDVYVNGQLATESTTIGYTSTIAYARLVGTNTFVVRATDTSGNVSAPSNELAIPNMSPC